MMVPSSFIWTWPLRRFNSRSWCLTLGFCVDARRSRYSSIGSNHSSPFSTMASIDLSLLTTVHTQHPNRLFPQEGVVVSTTNGHSPACALRYIVTRSLLLFPHGEGTCSR